jgi:lysine-ketoglutarate reductase/saccharopine dehydrogenase-like protein (TIGR00300 family)
MNTRYLMCPPDHFSVDYTINPWMENNLHQSTIDHAQFQWQNLYHTLQQFSQIDLLKPQPGLPDLVFTANAGLIFRDRAIVSRFQYSERQGEAPIFKEWFQAQGYNVSEMPEDIHFEGAGDALFDRTQAILWAGYGFRSDFRSHLLLSQWLDIEVLSLRLVEPHFYHLDTCFCPLTDGYLLYYPAAFDENSNHIIESRIPPEKRIIVSEGDAYQFACNAIEFSKTILLNRASDRLKQELRDAHFNPIEIPLSEFLKSGGSAKCLTLELPPPHLQPAQFQAVTQAGVAPDEFYATTLYTTEFFQGDRWITVEAPRMDATIVLTPDHHAHCKLLRDLEVGDRVLVGSQGIRTSTPATETTTQFGFMASGVSSERRVELAIDQIATELQAIRDRGGKTVVVAGPVVIHTGGGAALAKLIRDGYVQALLGGNAIAVHDIEQSLLGTALGIDLTHGNAVQGGHRHHLKVINLIRRYGSIAAAIDAGVVTSGVMYDCIRNGVPFALAGSIRDDGPLPDTQMDLIQAQTDYAKLLEGADLVLMLSSMLHSIGVGNMTPATVKRICIDINPAVVTKLSDRGSLDSIGIVTDVGLFLRLLGDRLA